MKVKFVGATPEEDQIVEIPEGTHTVEIPIPAPEVKASPWFSLAFIISVMVWLTVLVAILRG